MDGRIGSLQSRSIEQLYPLSPYQTAIYQDIVDCLAQRKRYLKESFEDLANSTDHWWEYRVLLGKPGTGKSQVVIRAIYHAIHQEYKVLLAAPVALLAQGADLEAETIHAAFRIPVDPQ